MLCVGENTVEAVLLSRIWNAFVVPDCTGQTLALVIHKYICLQNIIISDSGVQWPLSAVTLISHHCLFHISGTAN